MRRPYCIICDSLIQDNECYVLNEFDEMNSCVCESCMEVEIRKVSESDIEPPVAEFLVASIDFVHQLTPEDEDPVPEREDWYE